MCSMGKKTFVVMAVFISSLKIYPPYVDDEMSTFIRLDIGQDAHFRSYISKDIKT